MNKNIKPNQVNLEKQEQFVENLKNTLREDLEKRELLDLELKK